MTMKKIFLTSAAVLGIFASARAAEPVATSKTKAWYQTWFEHLKQGLAESSVQSHYQKSRVTAVAAVRGAKQESIDADKPGWIGGAQSKKAAQLKKERAEFGKSVDAILKGDLKEGLSGLDAFEKAHPKSPLLDDVKQARENAKLLQDQAEAAAPAVEVPAAAADKK